MATVAVHEGVKTRNVFTRADLHGDTVLDCDAVVVGSGAGGAPVAAELAEAGFDVIVLEEGSYYQTRDFTADTSAMVRQLYRDGGATMAIGNPPILFQEGRAVGGSTVINGGMSWRTPEDILARWRSESGLPLSTAELEPYFERVEKRIHVAPMDEAAIGKDNWLLKKGADLKGYEIIGNLRNQAHCVGSNRCAFGCPTGAKQSALVSYIPRALHYGARVYADVRVDRITMHGKRATGVVGNERGGSQRRRAREARGRVVRCDPHARAAGALRARVALGPARRQPEPPPERQGHRDLRRGCHRLERRAPGVPGPRVRRRRPRLLRGGELAAERDRAVAAASRPPARCADAALQPDDDRGPVLRRHDDRSGPHDRRQAAGVLSAREARRGEHPARPGHPRRHAVRGRREEDLAAVPQRGGAQQSPTTRSGCSIARCRPANGRSSPST